MYKRQGQGHQALQLRTWRGTSSSRLCGKPETTQPTQAEVQLGLITGPRRRWTHRASCPCPCCGGDACRPVFLFLLAETLVAFSRGVPHGLGQPGWLHLNSRHVRPRRCRENLRRNHRRSGCPGRRDQVLLLRHLQIGKAGEAHADDSWKLCAWTSGP